MGYYTIQQWSLLIMVKHNGNLCGLEIAHILLKSNVSRSFALEVEENNKSKDKTKITTFRDMVKEVTPAIRVNRLEYLDYKNAEVIDITGNKQKLVFTVTISGGEKVLFVLEGVNLTNENNAILKEEIKSIFVPSSDGKVWVDISLRKTMDSVNDLSGIVFLNDSNGKKVSFANYLKRKYDGKF